MLLEQFRFLESALLFSILNFQYLKLKLAILVVYSLHPNITVLSLLKVSQVPGFPSF